MRVPLGAGLLLALLSATTHSQTTVHQHYAKDPRADMAAPDGHVAPRLQSLGTHRFPVTTRSTDAQRLLQSLRSH